MTKREKDDNALRKQAEAAEADSERGVDGRLGLTVHNEHIDQVTGNSFIVSGGTVSVVNHGDIVSKRTHESPARTGGEDKIRILFLAASPTDLGRLRLDKEMKEIGKKIRAGSQSDCIELVSEWCVQPSDLQEALLRHCPNIVHFSGHGTKANGVVLEDDQGESTTVNKRAFADLFRILKDNISLVVLNSCYSADQANLIRDAIDVTIGMNSVVEDESAVVFAAYFYQALAFGKSVQKAFDLGINQLEFNGCKKSAVPELLVRTGVDPSTIILTAIANRERD